jgi:hypothetical protein
VGRSNTSIQCESAFQRLQGHCQVRVRHLAFMLIWRTLHTPEVGVTHLCIYMNREKVRSVCLRRVVSRGNISSRSSDFGALEVFAGASIGHTDPYVVHAAISTRLSAVSSSTFDQV